MGMYPNNNKVPGSAGSSVFAEKCIDPKLRVGQQKESPEGLRALFH